MNCCNSYGKCRGGHGCPVGDMPIQMVEQADDDAVPMAALHWYEWLMITLMVVCLFAAGFVVGRAWV